MVINVQCTSFITIWNDKKMLFALARLVLAFGLFLGFFWPSEGLRPSSGQKIPKNSPQVKTTRLQQKKIFVLPHVDIVVHFTLIYTIFAMAKKNFAIRDDVPTFHEQRKYFLLEPTTS